MPEELTARRVESIRVEKPTEIRDSITTGLILRVSSSGVKAWSAWGRVRGQGRPVRVGLGRYPRLSLADARSRALEVLREMELGRIPGRPREGDPSATIKALGAAFLAQSQARESTIREWRRLLARHVDPTFGGRDPRGIERREVRRWMADIPAPTVANRAFEFLRRLYTWAAEQDLLVVNPCAGIRPVHRERPRDRVLRSDEIRRTWEAAGVIGPLGPVVRLLLLTAARRGEVLAMRWSDLDLEAAVWRLPGSARKSGEGHTVPLTPLAVEILRGLARGQRKRGKRRSEWVFPSPTGEGPVRHPQGLAERLHEATGIQDATLHDLRRTVATRLAELGTPSDIVEAILGHARPGLVRTYQVYLPLPAMRSALEAWEATLRGILAPE